MSCIQLTTGAGERAIRIVKSFYRWGRNSSSRGGGQLVFDDHWSKRSKLNFLWNQKVKIDDIDTMAGRGGRWIYLSGNDGKWQMILKWVSTFFRWWWCGLGQQDRARIRIQSVGINDGATTEWIHTLYYTQSYFSHTTSWLPSLSQVFFLSLSPTYTYYLCLTSVTRLFRQKYPSFQS